MKITTTTALVIMAALQTGTTISTEQLGNSQEQHSPPGLSSFTYTLVASCSPSAQACKGLREKVDISRWSWAAYDKAGDLLGHSDRDRVTAGDPGPAADHYAQPGSTRALGLVTVLRPTPANPHDAHARHAGPGTLVQDRALQGLAAGKRNDIDRVHTEPSQPLSQDPRYSGFFFTAGLHNSAEFPLPISVLLFGAGLIALAGLKHRKS